MLRLGRPSSLGAEIVIALTHMRAAQTPILLESTKVHTDTNSGKHSLT